MSSLVVISYFSLSIWFYLLLFHGRSIIHGGKFFWSNRIIFKNKLKTYSENKVLGKVCVIIPARNEENTIQRTLNSVKNQKFKNLEIVVVNDNSDDRTALIVKKFQKSFKRLKLLNGKKLPKNWVGKTWALKQGVDYANKKDFTYYLFMDSDIVLKKNLLKNVVFSLEQNGYLMISLMAKLNCRSFWEKILIPPFIYFFQKLYPFDLVNKKHSNVAAAAGGFIFCQAFIFKKENLYNQIKSKLIDDCNVAKLFKEKGEIWLGLTNEVVSRREYYNLKSIWRMVSRTAFEQLSYSIILLFLSLIGLIFIYIFPSLLILFGLLILDSNKFTIDLFLINFFSLVIMVIVFIPTLHFYKMKSYFALTLPISACFYSLMTLSSAINYFLSGGNVWKGRKY